MSVKRFDILIAGELPLIESDKVYTGNGEYADGEVAQELYEALCELLKLHDNEVFTKNAWDVSMESAREALAKARGEQ